MESGYVTHKIGVISDTHGLLREEVRRILRGCEVILHAGDIGRREIMDALREIACVHAVLGNNDWDWIGELPEALDFELFGLRFYMVHDKMQIPEDLRDKDFIIYGHSHRYEERRDGGTVWLNPGSCGPRRFSYPITMALIETGADEGGCRVKKVEIRRF